MTSRTPAALAPVILILLVVLGANAAFACTGTELNSVTPLDDLPLAATGVVAFRYVGELVSATLTDAAGGEVEGEWELRDVRPHWTGDPYNLFGYGILRPASGLAPGNYTLRIEFEEHACCPGRTSAETEFTVGEGGEAASPIVEFRWYRRERPTMESECAPDVPQTLWEHQFRMTSGNRRTSSVTHVLVRAFDTSENEIYAQLLSGHTRSHDSRITLSPFLPDETNCVELQPISRSGLPGDIVRICEIVDDCWPGSEPNDLDPATCGEPLASPDACATAQPAAGSWLLLGLLSLIRLRRRARGRCRGSAA